MRTCWKTLPTFRQIGDSIMKKYYRARPIASNPATVGPRGLDGFKKPKKFHLVLKKGKMPIKKLPRKSDLVFLQMSPNYCEKDLTAGSLGTVGRTCNRTSRGTLSLLSLILMCRYVNYFTRILSVFLSTTENNCYLYYSKRQTSRVSNASRQSDYYVSEMCESKNSKLIHTKLNRKGQTTAIASCKPGFTTVP